MTERQPADERSDDYVQRIVTSLLPLTDDQRSQVAALLRSEPRRRITHIAA